MVLMGIDPSFSGCGITIKNKDYTFHLITAEKQYKDTIDITRRIMSLKKQVREIIQKERPNYIAIEGPSYGGNTSSLIQMGALNHILRELFFEEKIPFVVVPPKVAKKHYTGNGNANKLDMIEEAMNKGINIPFFKKIQKQDMFDDNVVDSHAMVEILEYILLGKKDYDEKVEKSWDLK